LLDEVQYDNLFSFKYSPRPNTPSLAMPDAIPEEEKGRRLAALQDKQREIQTKKHEALVGKTFEVLVSGKSRRENQWFGYSTSHRVINLLPKRTSFWEPTSRFMLREQVPTIWSASRSFRSGRPQWKWR